MELVLQGYYCLQQYNLTMILHCLKDVHQWWYFLLHLDGDTIVCDWCNSFKAATDDDIDIPAHVAFIDRYLQPVRLQRC